MRTLILGCGPAGLVAAHAAISLGFEAVIISNKDTPSDLYGCQYLHAPIPGYENVPRVRVSYSLNGTPEEYRLKVYGRSWEGKVSPEDFVGDHDAWDIRETYRRLWTDLITNRKVRLIKKSIAHGRIPYPAGRDSMPVVSTIPAPALCQDGFHNFRSHTIHANGSTGSWMPEGPDMIICDGTTKVSWYRMSNVFGYRTMEWPWGAGPARKARAATVVKPLSNTCDCRPEILRVGRYGRWEKGYLVHMVYADVVKGLSGDESV
jgi:hypothetical protein